MIRLPSWFGGRMVGMAQRAKPQLDHAARNAIANWNALPPTELHGPLRVQRWLVVDVETTGLDLRRDRLLAIGAVVVNGSVIRLDESFEVVLRQPAPSSTDNILIHRITGSEQLAGEPPAQALADFLVFAGKLPCVAFHAEFDETMLRRAFAEHLGVDFRASFLDLALLAPALVKDAAPELQGLDDWTAHFSITIAERHRAISDAMGTAQLLQKLLGIAVGQKIATAQQLFKLARHHRWLAKVGRH